MDNGAPVSSNPDSNNMALLVWVLTIFLGFIPSLIFYLTQKDNPYVQDQSKEALNWSITVTIALVALWIVFFIIGMAIVTLGLGAIFTVISLLGTLLFMAVFAGNLALCIMGAIACSKGQAYRCIFALRLIK